jgi:hypothetical protein
MRNEFCQNEYCDNPSVKDVRVSVNRASDEVRSLCATCEEAYTIGVQHGTVLAQAKPTLRRLIRFLKKDGFVIFTFNEGDASKHGPFEAWAYQGPLDLQTATPVTFGVGPSIPEAIIALEYQLKNSHGQVEPGAREKHCSGPHKT